MSEKDQILDPQEQIEDDATGRIVWSNKHNGGNQSCWFCQYELEPDYKDTEVLLSFLSPRGKILSKRITQTCSKHQRMLSKAIKVAREMALIR